MDFNELLWKLHRKEINEFIVEKEHYLLFHKAWDEYPYHNEIKGIASINGVVKYIRE